MNKNYEQLLTERFGVIGNIIAAEATSSNFPNAYHHYYIRMNNSTNHNLDGLDSNTQVASYLRNQFPDENIRELEMIKGALAYILEYRSEHILAEILANPNPAITQSYRDLQQFSKTLWYWQIATPIVQ